MPLISIITVSFNSADFIGQCMQSVLAQEFDDFEYVVIDGGSTDGTTEIIRKHSDRLAYWHSEPDRGVAHAFNQGVERSKGLWLLFLNSDDYFADNAVLGKLANAIRENPEADVVFGQAMMVSREAVPKRTDGPYGKPFRWNRYILINTIPHQAAATSRALFQRIGMFNEDFRIAMDYEHFLRAGPRLSARYVPMLVACMRDGGMSRDVAMTLKDWRRARIVSRALPVSLSWLVYYYTLCRAFIGQCWRGLRGWTT